MISSYPVALIVEGRYCLVIGVDREAVEKTQQLHAARAKVRLVCPEPGDEIHALKRLEGLEVCYRDFVPEDLDGVLLVINCMKERAELNEAIAAACDGGKFLFCAIDRPKYANITMSSICDRGTLRMTFNTGGTSPAMAKKLRLELERVMDETFIRFTYSLADLRERLVREIPDVEQRSECLRSALDGFSLQGYFTYPKWFLEGSGLECEEMKNGTGEADSG